MGFQRADDCDRRSYCHLIEQFGNLGVVQEDTTERLIRNALCDAMELDEAWHGLTPRNQPCLLRCFEASAVLGIGIIENKGAEIRSLSRSALTMDPIFAFRGGAISIVLLCSDSS